MSYTPTPGLLPAISDTNITQVNIDEINRGPAKLSLVNTQLSPTHSDLARPMMKPDGISDNPLPKPPIQARPQIVDPRAASMQPKYQTYRPNAPQNSVPDPSLRNQSLPTGPFQLTPHIAATLKIPYPGGGQTITPHLLIEFINISVIKSPASNFHEPLQPGMTAYEVVLTNQLHPGAEVVVAYPNQPVIWQGKEDGPERVSAINNLKASVWKHFTTTITQQLHHLNDPNYSHLHGYHPNMASPSAQILNRLRVAPQGNYPRSMHSSGPSPNAGIQMPVPMVSNGQYSQANARRYPIPTPVPMPIPGINSTPQQRRQPWEHGATGFAAHNLPRPSQINSQNNGNALLNATQQAYPQLVSHYFNSNQGNQQPSPNTMQLNSQALQLQQQQQQLLKESKIEAKEILMEPQQNKTTTPSTPKVVQTQKLVKETASRNPEAVRKASTPILPIQTPVIGAKRHLDDLKEYLPLVANQPERPSTLEQENVAELKRLRQENALDFNKYPSSFDLAVAVLEELPTSCDREASLNSTPSQNDYRNLAAEMLAVIAEKEAEKLQNAVASTQAATTTQAAKLGTQQMTTRSAQLTAAQQAAAAIMSGATTSKKSSKSKKEKEFAEEWVQCDLCSRWRLLPPPNDPQYPKELPEKWICSMNTWNPLQAMCAVPEETTSGSEVNTQRALKLRVWVRRLKSADRYENLHSRGTHDETRSYGEVDWIRCCNSNCGKWRACLRSMDARKLKKKYPVWYCWMNSWDEAKSSCDAPQEGSIVYNFAEQYLNQSNTQGDDDEDDWNAGEDEEDGGAGAGDGLTLQGISSRGRIVRSRWNSRRNRR